MKTISHFLKSFFSIISKSIEGNETISTPRFQSWIVLAAVLLQLATFATIEIFMFISAANAGIPHKISAEAIIIFGMVLSHQLALVFARNKSQSIEEIKGNKPSISDEFHHGYNNTETIPEIIEETQENEKRTN